MRVLDVEPVVHELLHFLMSARVVKHAPGMFDNLLARSQFASRRRFEQSLVRQRVPHRERQTGCNVVPVRLFTTRIQIEKPGRRQRQHNDAFERGGQVRRAVELPVDVHLALRVGQWTPKRLFDPLNAESVQFVLVFGVELANPRQVAQVIGDVSRYVDRRVRLCVGPGARRRDAAFITDTAIVRRERR